MEYVVLYITVAVYGLVFGSFLNVCILRIPAGESIIKGSSHCPICGRKLRAAELIPLFSWVFLRGKCKGCKTKISAQYPIIELANAVLWMLALYFCGFNLAFPLACALLSALLGLAVIDARTTEIPFGFNIFIGIIAVLRVGVSVYYNGISAVVPHLIGMAAVFLPLYIIYLVSGRRAVGGGDVKLMFTTGFFLGWQLVVFGFFAGCLIGSVVHVIRMKAFGAGRTLALGPYLAIGLAIALLFGDNIIAWYLGMYS